MDHVGARRDALEPQRVAVGDPLDHEHLRAVVGQHRRRVGARLAGMHDRARDDERGRERHDDAGLVLAQPDEDRLVAATEAVRGARAHVVASRRQVGDLEATLRIGRRHVSSTPSCMTPTFTRASATGIPAASTTVPATDDAGVSSTSSVPGAAPTAPPST